MGATILEGKKELFKRMVEEELRYIYPRVGVGCEIVLSFVPLVRHPYDYGVKTEVMDE